MTYWARGERNIGGVLPLIILTNCDEIEFRYGNQLSKRAGPDRQNYPHLPHPPIVFDERHFRPEEMGLWGSSWQDGTLVGYINGEAVKAVQMSSAPVPTTLQVEADQTSLNAMERDTVRVIARVLDQTGNVCRISKGRWRSMLRVPQYFLDRISFPFVVASSGSGYRRMASRETSILVFTGRVWAGTHPCCVRRTVAWQTPRRFPVRVTLPLECPRFELDSVERRRR